jgi:hypothetical protein
MISTASHQAQQVLNDYSALRLHTHCPPNLMFALTQPGTTRSASIFDDVSQMTSQRKTGSARRKLWELSTLAACPVIGVCLDFQEVKGMARKAGLTVNAVADYDLHCQVLQEYGSRSPLAELLQRALDQRFALTVKRSQSIKTTPALAQWWDEACQLADWASEFWALLTHPQCSEDLERIVLGQVHMLQHQIGHTVRADASQVKQLLAEQHRLTQELAASQQRVRALTGEHATAVAALQAQGMRLRASAIRAETERDIAQSQLQVMKHFDADGLARQRLLEDEQRLQTNNERLLLRALRRQSQASNQPVTKLVGGAICAEDAKYQTTECATPGIDLKALQVLCVGGRTSSIPVYREVIEDRGGSFVHHDGGEEDKASRLTSQLQAADVVICQVGCISHDAYWRVKEHCKRTGKPCLFVEMSGRSALERALGQLAEHEAVTLRAA